MENKYYSNYGTIEEQQKALYYNYMKACIVGEEKTPAIKEHNVTFEEYLIKYIILKMTM